MLSETEAQKLCSHVSNCSSQPHRREDTRSLLDNCKKQDCDLGRSWRKHPNSPPKAIVMPLKTDPVDISENVSSYSSSSHDLVCNTCQCYSKTLSAICDLKSNTQAKHSVQGWKNLFEAKDKMLAQKNLLIER